MIFGYWKCSLSVTRSFLCEASFDKLHLYLIHVMSCRSFESSCPEAQHVARGPRVVTVTWNGQVALQRHQPFPTRDPPSEKVTNDSHKQEIIKCIYLYYFIFMYVWQVLYTFACWWIDPINQRLKQPPISLIGDSQWLARVVETSQIGGSLPWRVPKKRRELFLWKQTSIVVSHYHQAHGFGWKEGAYHKNLMADHFSRIKHTINWGLPLKEMP